MRSWHRLLRVVLSLVSIALPATPASALDWIVVPYGLSPPAGAIRAADRLVHALAERRTPVASQHELKDLFLKRSRSQLSADPRLSKSVADARKHALEHAAYGRREAARRAAEEAMSVAESAPEALTDTDVARHVLDACLAVVRVDLQERDRPLAVQDAQRCRRLVPDLAPRESTHSAEVVGALAEAENELRRAGAGALNVVSDAREPCSVFLQGRRLGSTPFRYEHAPIGAAAVFVECSGARSRVHTVELDDREHTLTIDAGSDSRVADHDVIVLVYDSERELVEHLAGDVQRVGETAGARDVVLVRELPDGRVEAVRYGLQRKQAVAVVQLDASALLGPDLAPAQRAAEILATQRREAPLPPAFAGRPPPPAQIAASAADPEPPLAAQAAPPQQTDPAPRRRRVWTWTFAAGTVASGAAVLGLGLAVKGKVADQHECEERMDSGCLALTHEGDRLALAVNVMAGVTGGFAVATLTAFFVEGRQRGATRTALGIGPTGLTLRGKF